MWLTAAVALLISVFAWLANVALWADRSVIDEEAFTATVARVLVSDPARAEIAETIVDEAIEQVPVLALVKSPLTGIVASILGTELMENTVEFTARQAYLTVVEGEMAPLVISLIEVKDALLGFLEGFAPDVVELIPEAFFEAFEVLEEGALPSYSRLAAAAPWLWPIAALLGIGLAVTLLASSPRRPQALIAIGVALVVGALLTFVAGRIAQSAIIDDLKGDLVRLLGELSYDAFHASLVRQTLFLLGSGLLVMLGVAVWLAIETAGSQRVRPKPI